FIKKQFASLSQITLYAATPFALTAVLSDVLIAGALCILLHGNRSPFFRVVAIIEVIVFATSPDSLWFLAVDFVIGKLYANSFLASLNSRGSLRDRERQRNDVESSLRINTVRLSDWRAPSAELDSGNESRHKYIRRSTVVTATTRS
ncbi:hypothetical protein ID866_2828, partial [Astraeus odoratus]